MPKLDYESYGRIVCAALLKDNKIYYTFKNHGTIFTLEEKGVLRSSIQGFITEKGYFVDRKVGLEIAFHYNQIEYKHSGLNELFSEDLNKKIIKYLYIKRNINIFIHS